MMTTLFLITAALIVAIGYEIHVLKKLLLNAALIEQSGVDYSHLEATNNDIDRHIIRVGRYTGLAAIILLVILILTIL